MHFPDLSPCKYGGVSVGWLERRHGIARGPVLAAFLEQLLRLCQNPCHKHKGSHLCDFCPSPQWAAAAAHRDLPDGTRLRLGSGIVRVYSQAGQEYVAPDLIYHYVEAHKYQPPLEFIEAVMNPGLKVKNANLTPERLLQLLPKHWWPQSNGHSMGEGDAWDAD